MDLDKTISKYVISSIQKWADLMIDQVKEKYKFSYNYEKTYVEEVIAWTEKLNYFLKENAPTVDIFKFISFILAVKSFEELTVDGSKIKYAMSIAGSELYSQDIAKLAYILRCELLRIYRVAGYTQVMSKIITIYGENNLTIKRVVHLSGMNIYGASMCPLEHGLFLIRNCPDDETMEKR